MFLLYMIAAVLSSCCLCYTWMQLFVLYMNAAVLNSCCFLLYMNAAVLSTVTTAAVLWLCCSRLTWKSWKMCAGFQELKSLRCWLADTQMVSFSLLLQPLPGNWSCHGWHAMLTSDLVPPWVWSPPLKTGQPWRESHKLWPCITWIQLASSIRLLVVSNTPCVTFLLFRCLRIFVLVHACVLVWCSYGCWSECCQHWKNTRFEPTLSVFLYTDRGRSIKMVQLTSKFDEIIVIINISVAPSHYGHFCGTFTITVQLKMVAVRLEKHASRHLAEVSLMLRLKLFWCWLFQTHNSAKCIFYK